MKNPFRNDDDQPFANLQNYALTGQSSPQPQQPAQPQQLAQPATLQQPAQPKQQVAPAPQVQPAVPQPQAQTFGQPQQPQQPAQPRQTTMTPQTAAQRYNQMLQRNAPQAQAVSSGLAQVIENPAVEAQRGFDAAQKAFQQQVAQSGLTRNVGRTGDLIKKAAQLKAGESLSPEEFAELENIAKTKASFGEGIRDTDFVALQDYVTALGKADQAKKMAAMTSDTTGRQELLNKLVQDQNQYTSGQSLFDSLIAGGVKPATQQLNDVRKQLITEDTLGKAGVAAQEKAAADRALEQGEVDLAYKDIQDFLDSQDGGVLAKQEQDIRDRVAASNARALELNTKIDDVIKNKGSVFGDTQGEQDIIKDLNLTPDQVKQIEQAGPEVSGSIVNKLKEANEQTMTSADELARLNQLYKIADLTNRGKAKIQAQEDSDLGSLIGQQASINAPVLENVAKQNVSATNNKKQEINEQALQASAKDYKYAKGASIKNAALDIYERLRSKSFKPKNEIPEADKLISSLKQAVEKTQAAYADAGLPFTPPDEPSDQDVQNAISSIWKNSGVAKDFRGKLMYNGDINQLRAKNPKLYTQLYGSALRMVQIDKLANYMGFADQIKR